MSQADGGEDEYMDLDGDSPLLPQLEELIEAMHTETGLQPNADDWVFKASPAVAASIWNELAPTKLRGAKRVCGILLSVDVSLPAGEIHLVRTPEEG